MRSPKTGNLMREVEGDNTTHTFRGQEFTLSSPAWECPDTGARYFTPEQGNVFLARLHRAWRERNGLTKEALKQRTEALGLSDAQASALLGFGINQYRTYKNTDKLPSKSNARLLQMLCDDRALMALLDAAGPALNKPTRRKLIAYCAQHQTAALATAADLTATTVGLAGLHEALSYGDAFSNEALKPKGDYSYAFAA